MRSALIGAIAAAGAGGAPAEPTTWAEVGLTSARGSTATYDKPDGTVLEYATTTPILVTATECYGDGGTENVIADSDEPSLTNNATMSVGTTRPTGSGDSDRRTATANNGYARYNGSLAAAASAVASAFVKYFGGDADNKLVFAGASLPTQTDTFSATGSWARRKIAGASSAATACNAQLIENGATNDAALDIALVQVEEGTDYATPPVPTSGATASKLPDDDVVPSASVPTSWRSGARRFPIKPRRASTETARTSTETILAFGAGTTDRLYIDGSTNEVVVVAGGVEKVRTGALSWAGDESQTINVDTNPGAGSVTISGATSGNGTTVGSSWSWQTGDVQRGNDDALGSAFPGITIFPTAVP